MASNTFPPELGQPTRGLLTSYAAPPLNAEILLADELPPVWPWHEGHVRGISFQPLYKTVPLACSKDPLLYEYVALLDAARSGRIECGPRWNLRRCKRY
jgi:hypothetical protein